MDNGIFLPLGLYVHDLEALEEVFTALEIGTQRRRQEALAKSAGTAEKDVFHPGHFPDKVGLVNIDVVAFDDFRKGLDAYGVSSLWGGCHSCRFSIDKTREGGFYCAGGGKNTTTVIRGVRGER